MKVSLGVSVGVREKLKMSNCKWCATIKLKGAAFYKVSAQTAFLPVMFMV